MYVSLTGCRLLEDITRRDDVTPTNYKHTDTQWYVGALSLLPFREL